MAPDGKKLKLEDLKLKAYENAAAGHDGVLSSATGDLVIKPCTWHEAAFYQNCLATHPGLARFIPKLYGTLELGAPDASTPEATKPAHDRNSSIVLQNLTYEFTHPCVLDIKLGARLWDNAASLEKRGRLDAVANTTTSGSMGMRVAGMKVWNGTEYKVYDKYYGRTFTSENVVETLHAYLDSEISGEQKKMLARRWAGEVRELQELLEGVESRMYSASLLFVYEGGKEAMDAAIAEEKNRPNLVDEDEDDDEEDEDEKEAKRVCELKLIDFAHARWTGEGIYNDDPEYGQHEKDERGDRGPDENVLQGVRNVVKLLEEVAEI